MAETPCVVVNVMRGGPSTGLPTLASQGDVMQARWGTHGDHPIIVLAVSSVRDCFDIAVFAFNLSEKYRVPVIILSDEIVAHTRETFVPPSPDEIEVFDRVTPTVPPEWYLPYEDTGTGVPPMAAFGDGYRHHVTGLTHDERGFPTQRSDEINVLMRRLFRKITQGFHEIQRVETFMMEDAEIAVIAYGSVARSSRRAVIEAREHGVKAGLLQLVTLFPFPRRYVEKVLQQCRAVLVPEMNMGQISREVKRVHLNSSRVETLNRVDGRLITPREISDCLIKMYY
jgi:2-oxoglutarate ferredoxin oxidoreductase subunit alpha